MDNELTKEEKILLYKYNGDIYELMGYVSRFMSDEYFINLVDKLDKMNKYVIDWDYMIKNGYIKLSSNFIKHFKSKINFWVLIHRYYYGIPSDFRNEIFWKEIKTVIPYGYLSNMYEIKKSENSIINYFMRNEIILFMSDKEKTEFLNKHKHNLNEIYKNEIGDI